MIRESQLEEPSDKQAVTDSDIVRTPRPLENTSPRVNFASQRHPAQPGRAGRGLSLTRRFALSQHLLFVERLLRPITRRQGNERDADQGRRAMATTSAW